MPCGDQGHLNWWSKFIEPTIAGISEVFHLTCLMALLPAALLEEDAEGVARSASMRRSDDDAGTTIGDPLITDLDVEAATHAFWPKLKMRRPVVITRVASG